MKRSAAWTRKSLSLALSAALLLGALGPDLPRVFADPVDAGMDATPVSPRWTPVWHNYFDNLPSTRFEGRVVNGVDVGRVLSQVGGLQLESAEDRRAAAPMVAYLESRVGSPKAFVMLNQAKRDQLMSEAAAAAAAPLRSEAATLAAKVEKGQLTPDMYRYADSRLRELSRTGIYYMDVPQQHRVFAARDILAAAIRKASADAARRSVAQAATLWSGKTGGDADNGVAAPRENAPRPSAAARTAANGQEALPSPDAYEGRILPLSEAERQMDEVKAYRAQVVAAKILRILKAANAGYDRAISAAIQRVSALTHTSSEVAALLASSTLLAATVAASVEHAGGWAAIPMVPAISLLLRSSEISGEKSAESFLSKVAARRARLMAIPGVVAVEGVADYRGFLAWDSEQHYVRVDVTDLNAQNKALIASELAGYPVAIRIVSVSRGASVPAETSGAKEPRVSALSMSKAAQQLDEAKEHRAQVVSAALHRGAKAAWNFVRGKGWMIAFVGAGLLIGDNAYASTSIAAFHGRPIAGAAIGAVTGFAIAFSIAKAKAPGGGDYDFTPLLWLGAGIAGAAAGAIVGSVAASAMAGGGHAFHVAGKTLLADAMGGVVGFLIGSSISKARNPASGGDYDFTPLFWIGAGLLGAVVGVLIAAAAVSLL